MDDLPKLKELLGLTKIYDVNGPLDRENEKKDDDENQTFIQT